MWSEAELSFEANQKFAENVKAASGGRLEIEAFSSGSLMPYTEYYDAVKSGVVEIAQSGGGYKAGRDPTFAMVDAVSIIIGDYPRTLAWFWEGGGIDLFQELYAQHGFYYISNNMYTYAGESIVSKVPIRTLDDIKGLKIRAPELLAPVWAALEADVLTIPGAEVYTALSTGLIEASDWSSPAANMRLGYAEICPYYSKPGDYYMGGWGDCYVTLETWNALPDDLKAILYQAARVQSFDSWQMTAYDDLTAVGKLKEAGAEMVAWDQEVNAKMAELIREVHYDVAHETELGTRMWDALMEFLQAAEGQ
jgi:TRAP-type mannitol/chloroaromatic compound transport system substrate-binding protein